MTGKTQTVVVTIMGKDYKIACSLDERESLLKSAHHLDEAMCKIRDSGKILGPERIAVMAALNLSHELQSLRTSPSTATLSPQGWKDSLSNMMAKIENILEKQ